MDEIQTSYTIRTFNSLRFGVFFDIFKRTVDFIAKDLLIYANMCYGCILSFIHLFIHYSSIQFIDGK